MRRLSLFGVLACIALLFAATNAVAAESGFSKTSHTTAAIVTNTDAVGKGVSFEAALSLQMAPGWHTYWQNPGDAGIAPDITVEAVPGTVIGQVEWPAPERVAEGDLTTFAYRGQVVLPFRVTPGDAPLDLKVHATWLVCRDICVPEEASFTLSLPAGAPAPSAQSSLFAAAAARIPTLAPFRSTVTPDGTLTLSGAGMPQDVARAEFFPSGDGQAETAGVQQPSHRGNDLTLRLGLGSAWTANKPLDGVVALTHPDGSAAWFTVSAKPVPTSAVAPVQSLLLLLLAALGGGLLLNLMPCVFPVLAMKAMALARLSAADRRTIRAESGSYVAGVILAFTALGGALLAVRDAGVAAGWGFQFQSPIFVMAVAWLLFGVGLNMSGVFEIGARLAGSGHALATKSGHAGSFFTGLLAVVVATPCTASFMGAALAGALAAPAATALAIFATMGLGLALPYAIVAALPRVASILPRPGRWMVTLRQALAFPMYGAAVWLVWVLSQQAGPGGVLTAGAGLVALGFGAWALGAAQASSCPSRYWGYGAAGAAGLATLALLVAPAPSAAEASEPFTPARLAELQQQGRPVFVNMTAAWCLSCLVNERLALSPPAVRAAFASAHIAYLKGDWTRQDPAISTFLRDHDRDGVPLYVFYAPGQAPVILPQILSKGTLLAQIARLHT